VNGERLEPPTPLKHRMPSSPARHGVVSDASIHHHRAAKIVTCDACKICGGAFLPALKQEYESCRLNNVVSKTPDGRRFVMLPSQCGDLLCAGGDGSALSASRSRL
jgi:hypothetical protein